MIDKTKYIERFKELYKNKTSGQTITDDQALAGLERLSTLVRAVYRPVPARLSGYAISGGYTKV